MWLSNKFEKAFEGVQKILGTYPFKILFFCQSRWIRQVGANLISDNDFFIRFILAGRGKSVVKIASTENMAFGAHGRLVHFSVLVLGK